MSLFSRVLPPLHTTRRAYSSFFSSGPGGGRYFNSAKPPKTVVTASKGKGGNARVKDSSANGSNNAHNGNGVGGQRKTGGGVEEPSQTKMQNTSSQEAPSQGSLSNMSNSFGTERYSSSTSQLAEHFNFHNHPSISAQDYKLHQFFSLHRPLLLHAQPPSSLFESAPESVDIFARTSSEASVSPQTRHVNTLDNPPEASLEADADTARQLARAFVVNRVGATVSWESTLNKLGLSGNTEQGKAELAKEWAREWDTVYTDSVKRKRKKKMKKHKLKKRRRAQRSQRLRMK